MTIGNIPKDICCKPLHGAWILLGYLPVMYLKHVTNKSARHRALANLFHACMCHILQPLEQVGKDDIPMTSGDGIVLITGTKTECPKCDIEHDELSSANMPAELQDLNAVLDALALVDEDYIAFAQACQNVHIKPIYKPFWEHHLYLNIFLSITTDILHQLYQGLLKHLLSEHDQICRFLMGIIVDNPLPGDFSATYLLCATRALLDFIYSATRQKGQVLFTFNHFLLILMTSGLPSTRLGMLYRK
ncbi:hypothetical protein JVT61DRAFT_34 [Boletus reticuloceps]|uniref:Uncharacterized protein n=1 Tax=Boletus reticuloceps TaxID=495285 RepID=A0A8I2Z118_9AGAM|nr:hypothetical protein JVT61DRAFT_34 [Boletus reticuloceps]